MRWSPVSGTERPFFPGPGITAVGTMRCSHRTRAQGHFRPPDAPADASRRLPRESVSRPIPSGSLPRESECDEPVSGHSARLHVTDNENRHHPIRDIERRHSDRDGNGATAHTVNDGSRAGRPLRRGQRRRPSGRSRRARHRRRALSRRGIRPPLSPALRPPPAATTSAVRSIPRHTSTRPVINPERGSPRADHAASTTPPRPRPPRHSTRPTPTGAGSHPNRRSR